MTGDIGRRLTFGALFGWAGRLFRHPWAFFRGVSPEGGYLVPMGYALFWQFLAGTAGLFLGFLPGVTSIGVGPRLVWFVLGPFFTLALGFVLSGFLFVIWHLMGSRLNYRAAFLCWALLTPLWGLSVLFSLVPYLFLAVGLYWFFLLGVASTELHQVPRRRAWVVWSALAVLSFFLLVTVSLIGAARNRLLSGAPVSLPPAAFSGPEDGPPQFPTPPGGAPDKTSNGAPKGADRVEGGSSH